MASRIHRVWATCCRQTLLCLQNHWCQGETGSIWWITALVLPLPFSKRREAREKKKRKKNTKKKNWRETERGEGERSVKEEGERDSTRWIMQSCQRRLLLEVLAVLKGASPDLHQLHLPLSPLPMAGSRLICAPANGQQQDEEEGGGQATWWQVDCLGGTHWQRQVRSLLLLFTEVTDREIWADLYSGPCGNIITEQRLSEELPFQHSGQRWLLRFCRVLCVLTSGE